MSAICGFVGDAKREVLDVMLAAVHDRGDRADTAIAGGIGIGVRAWDGRPGTSPRVARLADGFAALAGTLSPSVADPAAELPTRLADLAALDGSFAGVIWDGRCHRLTMIRDPFGARPLYHAHHAGTFWFASELKMLLAIQGFPVEPDLGAIHEYLTFSFVPGEDTPLRGVRCFPPGHVGVFENGALSATPYFELTEHIDPALSDNTVAARLIWRLGRQAVGHRLTGEPEVGLYLSGGLDSSAIAVWLRRCGANVRAFTLDFGSASVELDQARLVARHLGLPLTVVPVNGAALDAVLMDLAWNLDMPYGDAVTGPQYLLGKAASEQGLTIVFNGEGGDQLFGGWTSKPMIAAQLFANLYGEDSREQQYLRSYHRFFGLEDRLYTPRMKEAIGPPGSRRARLAPFLHSRAETFLNRVRLADVSLKGSRNILPRMERTTQCWGLDARVPLFDRVLAEASFALPPRMKLHAACEKYVLKLAMSRFLPRQIVWRRKFGMSVPITDWVLGPMRDRLHDLLGPEAVRKRGLFEPGYVAKLLAGHGLPGDARRRRIGERLWCLAMLEAWMRVFIDGRGQRSESNP